MRTLARPYFNRRWDIHERGQGYVPERGPVILASNHIGWLDGPLLFVRSPRPAHALVKEEEFVGKTGRLLKFVGQIKVSRTRNDTGALRRAAQALAAGQAVLIYPEGKRGAAKLRQLQGRRHLAGAGQRCTHRAGRDLRHPPARGSRPRPRAPKGARLDVVYGKPLQFPMQAWPRDREILADAGEQIHEHLRSHVTWSQNVLKRELPGPLPRGSSDG